MDAGVAQEVFSPECDASIVERPLPVGYKPAPGARALPPSTPLLMCPPSQQPTPTPGGLLLFWDGEPDAHVMRVKPSAQRSCAPGIRHATAK